jgi:phytoene dehydrogenase-like protein
MKYDAVIIGAGLGGLVCGARLVRGGRRVLILDRVPQAGGTSYVFRREGFAFPMGALAFGFPEKVKAFIAEAGLEPDIIFRRNHFGLAAPGIDLVYSRSWPDLAADLGRIFPGEKAGISDVVAGLESIVLDCGDLEEWHPDFLTGSKKRAAEAKTDPIFLERVDRVRRLARTPSGPCLDKQVSHPRLRNFLGSMGTDDSGMSMLNLAIMWNIMSGVGIWSPSRGIHGLADALAGFIRAGGGEIRLSTAVARIRTDRGRVRGVTAADGEAVDTRWVVSTADVKTTFLGLLGPGDVPAAYLDFVRRTPYTGSELCIYLGVDASRIDWSRMRADHVYFRGADRPGPTLDPSDFSNREIGISVWAKDAPDLVSPGKASLLIRVPFPYDRFDGCRAGENKRAPGYPAAKARLVRDLLAAAERFLPGLSRAVEVMDAATPLTYRDWSGRPGGSIAGWSWDAWESGALPAGLLVETPVSGLLTAGLYASPVLFLGGIPTSMYTGLAAARLVLED